MDASFALDACARADGLELSAGYELVAPALMWSEFRSALHEGVWRGVVEHAVATAARGRLAGSGITRQDPDELDATAWAIADELGVAKTYDAEYLALARLLGGVVVTVDGRLRRGADRTGLVIGPTELP